MIGVPMSVSDIISLTEDAKYILRNEGWLAVIKQGCSFVRNLLFCRRDYYIYTVCDNNLNSVNIDCTPITISSLADFDRLIAQGYDFKARSFRPKLKKEAIAFCLFVGKELVSVTWVACSKKAKKEIDYLPFKVNYEVGVACSGASYTVPDYRGNQLLAHTYSYILPYLANEGFHKVKFSINKSNITSQKAYAKIAPAIIGMGRYWKIFCWGMWRERHL